MLEHDHTTMTKRTWELIGAGLIGIAIGAGWALVGEAQDERIGTILRSSTPLEEKILPPAGTTTILFTGDVMPSRYVAAKMRARGYDYPFSVMGDTLRGADLTVINLESPIAAGDIVPNGSMTFRTDPEFIGAMERAGIDVAGLANNHTANLGAMALRETLTRLASSTIRTVGAGEERAAYSPLILERHGVRIAFTAQNDTDVVPPESCARNGHTGTACYDLSRVTETITQAKKDADVVIFLMHSGTEYADTANTRQRTLAHAAINAGADLVIGTHPHVVQNMEVYNGKRIYYSLGNFIFDQNWSHATRLGLIVRAHINNETKRIVDIDHSAVRIDDYAVPTPATENEEKDVLDRLRIEK